MHDLILRVWQHKNAFYYLVLIPLSWVFSFVVWLRRCGYKAGLLPSHKLPVPVVIIGNINMGGSGKTPVVMWLVNQLKKEGYHPGVVSRGYGVRNVQPIHVQQDSLVTEVGDEPLLIARRSHCPVWVGINRVEAGKALLTTHSECDVIISDDGLQHYRLQRNIEVVVVDNETTADQRLLPAGPLREPLSRLQTVDAIISNRKKVVAGAFEMQLTGQMFYNLANPEKHVTLTHFKNKSVAALAGIGKPERFFDDLKVLGLDFKGFSFEDHHVFIAQDLDNIECDVLIMTEKDAVKCEALAKAHHWVFPVEAKMEAGLMPLLLRKLKTAQH